MTLGAECGQLVGEAPGPSLRAALSWALPSGPSPCSHDECEGRSPCASSEGGGSSVLKRAQSALLSLKGLPSGKTISPEPRALASDQGLTRGRETDSSGLL